MGVIIGVWLIKWVWWIGMVMILFGVPEMSLSSQRGFRGLDQTPCGLPKIESIQVMHAQAQTVPLSIIINQMENSC